MNKDLKYIKKHYSEKMARICRDLFPTLLETPGLLSQVFDKKFDKTSSLGDALRTETLLQDFQSFVYSQVDIKKTTPQVIDVPNAFDLMAQAGYKLYPECLTEEDVQSFRGLYYRVGPTPVYKGGTPEQRSGEEICTFNGGRLSKCRVWFAVKEGAESLKRSNFGSPSRQDDYGTSVISIQFTRTGSPELSIKNRYNHSVANPDATFSNNLENIVEGLTQSWSETFGLPLEYTGSTDFPLNDFVLGCDGKYYKSNCRDASGLVYCENNVIVDRGFVVKLSPDYMLVDNHIFDFKRNRVLTYHDYRAEHPEIPVHQNYEEDDFLISEPIIDNGFVSSFGKVSKLEIKKGKGKERVISVKNNKGEDVIITINKNNQIVEVYDPNSTELPSNYLRLSKAIRSFSAPKVTTVGNHVLYGASVLQSLSLPNVEVIGDYFTSYSTLLKSLDLPKLRELGSQSFQQTLIKTLNIPSLEKIGDRSFSCFNSIPTMTGQFFRMIKEDSLEDVFFNNPVGFFRRLINESQEAEDGDRDSLRCLGYSSLVVLNAPNLREIGNNCFEENAIKEFNAPKLQSVGKNCFTNTMISTFNCGIPIEQTAPALTEEDQKLLSACNEAILVVQQELLKIKTIVYEDKEDKSFSLETTQSQEESFVQQDESVLIPNAPATENVLDNWKQYKQSIQDPTDTVSSVEDEQ